MHTISGDLFTDILRIHKSKISQRNMWDGSEVGVSGMRICSTKKKKETFYLTHYTKLYIRVIKGPNNVLNYKVLGKIFL